MRQVLDALRPCRARVVYGGQTGQQRTVVELIPWISLHRQRFGGDDPTT